jgi:hypothetical protein
MGAGFDDEVHPVGEPLADLIRLGDGAPHHFRRRLDQHFPLDHQAWHQPSFPFPSASGLIARRVSAAPGIHGGHQQLILELQPMVARQRHKRNVWLHIPARCAIFGCMSRRRKP